jgi:hypothetical protein
MFPRLRFLASAASILLLASATSSMALEKRSVRMADGGHESWSRGTTPCTVTYYNTCTGWIWVWSGWLQGDRLGTAFSACCPSGQNVHQLTAAWIFAATGSPSGYGFTGSLDVWSADAQECPTGPALHSQPFLPLSGWNGFDWSLAPIDVSGGNFAITYTLAPGAAFPDPVSFSTDHPEAGPTGGPAAGTCYPTSRVVHSYWYGTAASPYCPGSKLSDALADAEFLLDCDMICATPVQTSSWGQIKGLYR